MRFLVDRCAGTGLANWLRREGHDVADVSAWGPDPGDRAILEHAARENRILITLDQDFGVLVFTEEQPHSGIVRLPDCPPAERMAIVASLIARHGADLEAGAIFTVRGGRVRISHRPHQG